VAVEGTCLTQLDEFRSNRSEFTAKLAEMKQRVEDQRQQYTDKLQTLEEKHERDRQRSVLLLPLLMLMIIGVVSGLVVECRTRKFQVTGSNLTAGHLQATLSKLLTYGVLRSTRPPTLCGMGNEN